MTNNYSQYIRHWICIWREELIYGIDQVLDLIHHYVDLPLQKIFSYFCYQSTCCSFRRRWVFDLLKTSTTHLVHSFFITFCLYFLGFFLAQMFSQTLQRIYYLSPFISPNQQCISIPFVRISSIKSHDQLHENFLQERPIITDYQMNEEPQIDYSSLHNFFNLLEDTYYILCHRSLYLYARFQTYSSLLHSNFSYYRFNLPQHPHPFSLDRPPFLDLCLHVANQSHLNSLISRLTPVASYYYPSVNVFLFNYNFTQITLTLYQLDTNSTHLERVSIHTGWLYDLYKQIDSFKYERALSTVLFDGLSTQENYVHYFDSFSLPLPSDPLLALNEMIQQDLMVLPPC